MSSSSDDRGLSVCGNCVSGYDVAEITSSSSSTLFVVVSSCGCTTSSSRDANATIVLACRIESNSIVAIARRLRRLLLRLDDMFGSFATIWRFFCLLLIDGMLPLILLLRRVDETDIASIDGDIAMLVIEDCVVSNRDAEMCSRDFMTVGTSRV